MQAIYYEGNKQLRIGEATMLEPGPGEVRIAVSYAGICGTDMHIYHGHMDQRVTFPHIVRGVPVSSIVLEELETSLSSSDLAQVEVIDKVAPEANAFSSRPKGYGAWTDEWTKISQAVGFGMMTPEEAYEELKKKWDEIIQL